MLNPQPGLDPPYMRVSVGQHPPDTLPFSPPPTGGDVSGACVALEAARAAIAFRGKGGAG